MGVKRNPSFKSSIQDCIDDVFNTNSAENTSATTALLEKSISPERALSFSRGKEFLHVPEGTSIHTWTFNNGKEILHLHDKDLKNKLMEEKAADARHVEEVLQAEVEDGDTSPGPSMTAEVGRLEEERLDSGGVYDASTNASITTSGAPYHSTETKSLLPGASRAAPFEDISAASHHCLSDGPQPDHPLLGAHVRSTSTILHAPSPIMHPITAQSNVKRLEEGVRSRSSTDNLYDAVSMRRARKSIDTLYERVDEGIMSRARASVDPLYSEVEEVVRSRGSGDTLDGAMISLPRAMALVDTLQGRIEEVVRSRGGGSEERNERSEMVLLPRLSFEAPGGWSLVEILDASG